ncbi:MAG TPA: SPOR domain-containing protein [Gammaproteobacteria bacterium]|nr:SPOR domain-containing protein [Gammaproteobacteria bacterium]
MRALFLLLLLANVAFFGWNWYQTRILPGGRAEAPSTAGQGRGLELLGDLPAGQLQPIRKDESRAESPQAGGTPARRQPEPPPRRERPPAAKADAPEPPAEQLPARCYRAERIEARAGRDRLLQALKEHGVDARSGTEEGHGESHWVLLPPFPDEDAAREVMARLREKGVQDLYLVPSGENRNAISLGVFKERPRADQRLARLRRLGFDPEMRSLPLPSTRYWVRFRWPGGRAEPPLSALAETAGVEVERVDCP